MPIIFVPENDEEVRFYQLFHPSKKVQPFAVAATKEALYILQSKVMAVSDPWFYLRIPVSEVKEVSIKRIPPFAMYLLSLLLFISGLYLTYAMLAPAINGEPTKMNGYPISFIVVGLVLPFILRGRWSLIIYTAGKTIKWKPPLLVDSKSRVMVQQLQTGFINACQGIGIHVTDKRA